MDQPQTFRILRRDAWILGALAFALVIRLIGLGAAPLWYDEVDTALWTVLSPEQLVQTVFFRVPFGRYSPEHLPLYFVSENLWTSIAGFSPWLLRLPSVVYSTIAVALTAAIALTLVNVYTARWAAWLAALSPYLLHHAQEARMYPLIAMLAAAGMLMMIRFLKGTTARLGAGFVLINIALLITHYYGFFLVGAELLILTVFWARPWKSWLPAAVCCGLASVALLYVALVLTPHSTGELYSIGLFAVPGAVWSMLSGYTLLPSSEELHAEGMRAVRPYLPYALIAVAPFAMLFVSGLRALQMKARIVLLIILGCVVVGPFAVYAWFPGISINPRYLTAGAPALLVLLAAGIPQDIRAFGRVASSLVVVGIMIIGSVTHLSNPGQKREDVPAAGRWLDGNVSADEEILVSSDEMADLAYYHWPNRRLRLYPDKRVVANSKNAATVADGIPFDASGRAIYVVGRAWRSDPDGALQKALEARYQSCPGATVRGIRIYCLEKSLRASR